MMRSWVWISAFVAAVVAVALAWPRMKGPDLSRGAAIYAEACASCHGAKLEGQPDWRSPGPDGRLPAPPHDETGHTWHHPDQILMEIMAKGTAAVVGRGYESNMPGFTGVYTEAEMKDVLAWIKSQWPKRERAYQAEVARSLD
jgi:mono/diheme cytochrome c family protein